uniref:ATPase family AAA domain-containing protein 5 n=1 Tax=Oryzias latipes TaxID=8090 RepID=A0A3P9IY43_ORYLA
MAGVVAMASVIEDFDTQPCKKSRKDSGGPAAKPITNYFSPVPKPVEKPFSPPHSNNIMSYFCRKASSSKEQTCPPEPTLEKCQESQDEEKQRKSEGKRAPSQKRSKKTGRCARQLAPAESIGDVDCMIVEEAPENTDSAADLQSTVDASESDQPQKNDIKSESALQTSELTPRNESKSTKASQKQRKKKQNPSEPEKEAECDVSLKASNEEAACIKDSTVKISFEEFLRSQSKNEDNKSDDEGIKTTSEEKTKAEQLDIPTAEQHVDLLASPLQISPRTVTIQAEVHAISPDREDVKRVGKLASIFNQKRSSNSPVETSTSPHTDSGPKHSSPTVKLKSNVVLQEEDLELSVLESESTPKCSEAERKQFMAAFKQPSVDGPKSKPVKSQGKQKEAADKTANAADKTADGEDVIMQPTVEKTQREKKEATKKRQKKGRIEATEKNEAANTSPAGPDVTDAAAAPPVPVMRRSRREAVIRQTSQSTPTTPVRKTRRQQASNEAVTPSISQESPLKLVPSKTRKSKYCVFVAEIISPPDTKQSPIRIKFSRVNKDRSASEDDGEVDKVSSQKSRATHESHKRKQAKKLVEKAKQVIEQNKKSAVKREPVRRSGRNKAVIKRSYCEDEDSVICLEDQSSSSQNAPEKKKPPKALRSLNDVLGKAAPAKNDFGAAPGSKSASPGQEKSAQRPSAVISIVDDSSCEGSENSKDDGQFRARREFLKSGLPESFKKQIARTVASKEAYSVSCSSFQPVSHTTQPPDDCPLWNLPWPESSLLRHLKEPWGQTLNPLPAISGSLGVKTKSSCRNAAQTRWDWRPGFSESVRQLLVEEFRTSNPNFPAEMCISRLVKRRTDHQLLSTPSEPKAGIKDNSSSTQPVGGKRKRRSDEGETTAKVAKKQKSSQSEENLSTAAPESPRRETRRSQRARLQDGEGGKKKATLNEDDCVVVPDDVVVVEDPRKKDVVEDLLWTDKYQPQLCSEIIDNPASVKRLYSWLKEWKLRTDREEKKNQKSNKPEEGNIDSDWDGADEYGEDTLCNTMLIVGPTGVGKTAAVYACAQELGFKVFEVNASSQRSGRLILSQLKEATQSHQVDSQGRGAPKHSYFTSYGTSSASGTLRPGSSPRKGNSPRRVVSSPRKNPQSPRGAKKGGLAPVSLANFFKVGKSTNKESSNSTKDEQKAAPKKVLKATESGSKNKDLAAKSSSSDSTSSNKSSEERSKKTATSLILFEEVDVIFDDDSGFLAAIKTFMSTTKRPVILTTSDPAFSSIFDGSFEEVHFKPPSVMNVGGFLQLLCLAEDVRTDPSDVRSLLRLNGCDIRQSLLQLQFWSSGADGRPSAETHKHAHSISKAKLEPGRAAAVPSLPVCEKGCTQSKLGLLNIEPDKDIWKLLRSPMTEPINWELLMESKRRGVDLLYSNLETLLPLPQTQMSISKPVRPELSGSLPHKRPFGPSPQQPSPVCDGLPPSASSVNQSNESDSSSPIKVSSRMKRNKKRLSLHNQDRLESESDSEDGFLSLRVKQTSTPTVEAEKEAVALAVVTRKPLTPEERIKSVPVSQCLQSVADFIDDMSYMDSWLYYSDGGHLCRRTPPGGAVIKDGMTDEPRVETETDTERWITESRTLEIQAAVEALSFRKCQESAADAWNKVQQLGGELEREATAEVTLPLAPHREGWTFTQESICQPQLVQQRSELMGSLMFGGVFGTLGNRQAAALDYLPVIRTICRSEQLKEQGKVKRRFLHYLDAIHLGLDRGTLQNLAEDFP